METLTCIVNSASKEFQDFISYMRKYPVISSEQELCAYYRKKAIQELTFFLIYSVAIFFVLFLRAILLLPSNESNTIFTPPFTMITSNLANGALSYYAIHLKRLIKAKEYKNNYAFQSSMRIQIHLYRFIPIFGIMCTMIICILRGANPCLMWQLCFLMLFCVCTGLFDTVFWRSVTIIICNIILCVLIHIKSGYKEGYLNQIILPITFAIFFFAIYDRREKENFILKQMLKSQKNMCFKF